MFVVVTRLKSFAANTQRVQNIIHSQLVPAMQRTIGFIDFATVPAESQAGTDTFINISRWENQAAFDAYFKIRNTVVSPALISELMSAPPERLVYGEAIFHEGAGVSR
jgi:heme-degrading monooxygenase HmoA